ncbi:hypothetical protein ACJ72_02821 [Emergomyces africanus]|uniref:Uncharacterized protein n=1 Tax=Emergomyces africanus TaxID=1955775 RepID=A0A1B7P1C9_9EURO|nr:hypothetical protein ACJ72_02821 [Emergomyces africanus]
MSRPALEIWTPCHETGLAFNVLSTQAPAGHEATLAVEISDGLLSWAVCSQQIRLRKLAPSPATELPARNLGSWKPESSSLDHDDRDDDDDDDDDDNVN